MACDGTSALRQSHEPNGPVLGVIAVRGKVSRRMTEALKAGFESWSHFGRVPNVDVVARPALDVFRPPGAGPQPRLPSVLHDAELGEPWDLTNLWLDLCARRKRVVDGFFTSDRCYAVLAGLPDDGCPKSIGAREREILERVLLGERLKTIAMDLHASVSGIAAMVLSGFRRMGVSPHRSRRPSLLVSAVGASRGLLVAGGTRLAVLERGAQPRWVVSTSRVDTRLSRALTRAEVAVVRSLVEGRTSAEIARIRGSSERTIANQISAVFRKLGVSGRPELLSYLVRVSSRLGPVDSADEADTAFGQKDES